MLLFSLLRRANPAEWDIRSGSETQLNLEEGPPGISLMAYATAFNTASFFLFITLPTICIPFSGAMCANGLPQRQFGVSDDHPKIVNFLLAGVWLIVLLRQPGL
jgi:hypothetical protein